MKKNLGKVMALYPMPLVVVGTMIEGKPNWLIAGHVGIIGHDRLMLSSMKNHYTNIGVRENKVLSVNIVDEKLLPKADYVGSVSGFKIDKSEVFSWHIGEFGAPILEESLLVMECHVEDIYETIAFDNFVLEISATLAEESILNAEGKIDYNILKPILFEFPTYSYYKTGDFAGKCLKLDKEKNHE
ncbi:flavin reductase family protein [Bacteroides sp.]|uniref:flavin reductase family protein n=1 Tax=Bacteroides sp. TaxID=29523 RepID=UPI00261FE6CC|nr:flavin reductase family protein [Bacteroides sp.]MDD3040839.1 flavin reductase family protein [Bacteroides sp.]